MFAACFKLSFSNHIGFTGIETINLTLNDPHFNLSKYWSVNLNT